MKLTGPWPVGLATPAEESGRFMFQSRAGDRSVTCQRGDYTVTWRREADGIWRIVADRARPDAAGPPGPCAATG